jgi:hypothetical protein
LRTVSQCSIYGSQEAGERLNAMLEMGRSRPWQEALEALTGNPEMDATAILNYLRPCRPGFTSKTPAASAVGEQEALIRYLSRPSFWPTTTSSPLS